MAVKSGSQGSVCYRFDDLELDPGQRRVRRGNSEIELPKLSYEFLLALVTAAPDAVSSDDLMDQVWAGAVVSPSTIAKRAELLREALGDDSSNSRYVALVRGHGYRLIPTVSEVEANREAAPRRRQLAAALGVSALLASALAALLLMRHEPPLPERSIAVLPFESYSSDANDELLADGLTEELIHELARIPELKVVGRTSSFVFKNRSEDLRAVGDALGVANVLEGSVRRSGETLRVTVQLVNTDDGFHRWSNTYDRTMSDVLAIQEDIAIKAANALRVSILGSPREAGSSRDVDPEAYALYLRAVSLSVYGDHLRLGEAQQLLEKALDLDAEFAAAWNRLAAVHGRRLFVRDPEYPYSPAKATLLIKNAIERGRQLNPEDAEVYANLAGFAWVFEEDAAKAAPLIERALKLAPNDLDIIRFAIDFATSLGRYPEAVELSQRLVEREPLCIECRIQLARLYMLSRRWDDADDQYAFLQTMGVPGFHWSRGIVFLHQGRARDALESFEKHTDFEYLRLQGRASALHDLGMEAESAAAIETLRNGWADTQPVEVAQALAYVGRVDEAFALIDSVLPEYTSRMQADFHEPLFHRLHSDKRWGALMKRIGRAPEQVDQIPFSLPDTY